MTILIVVNHKYCTSKFENRDDDDDDDDDDNNNKQEQKEAHINIKHINIMLDYLLQLLQFVWSWIVSYFFGPVITMDDSGIRVRCQHQIAEGGFSVIFLAIDVDDRTATTSTSRNKYVLKRIRCHDSESRSACVKESNVHYAMQKKQRQQHQKNGGNIIAAGGGGREGGIPSTTTESMNDSLSSHFMPLLGTTFSENNTVC